MVRLSRRRNRLIVSQRVRAAREDERLRMQAFTIQSHIQTRCYGQLTDVHDNRNLKELV